MEPAVTATARHYLETGEDEPGDIEVFMLQGSLDRLREAWEKVKTEILPEWIRKHPGTRPAAWWEFDAPQEPVPGWPAFHAAQRRRIGGVGVPQHDVIAVAPRFDRGTPCGWFDAEGAAVFEGAIPVDPNNPPTFESEASYLSRLELLTPAEVKYLAVRPELLEPEAVVFDDDDDVDAE
jgi:hypothetical protein